MAIEFFNDWVETACFAPGQANRRIQLLNQSKLIEANRTIGFDCRMQSNGNRIFTFLFGLIRLTLIDFDYHKSDIQNAKVDFFTHHFPK